MRIATLQFSPQVGKVQANIDQADSLLVEEETQGRLANLDLLVLPEMAFSGYNFSSLDAIRPYLEPTAAGVSTQWAIRTSKRLKCTVAVGYPEIATSAKTLEASADSAVSDQQQTADIKAYNSLVFVNAHGTVVAHTRKAFLYYTDDTWAQEGPEGFLKTAIPIGTAGEEVQIAAGICMDIQPYKFEAPFTAYEFANHCVEARAKVIIVSMAWLTRLSYSEVFGMEDEESEAVRQEPDMGTVSFWIQRFSPVVERSATEDEVIVVFANRAGEEGIAPIIGPAIYAGSSSVMRIKGADLEGDMNVDIWNMLGRAENAVLVVDTNDAPLYGLRKGNT